MYMMNANPAATFPLVLRCDQGLPRDKQVRWFLRNLSQADWEEYKKLGDEQQDFQESQDPDAQATAGRAMKTRLFAELRRIVAGWQGVCLAMQGAEGQTLIRPAAFDPDRLEEALTLPEAWELYYSGLARLELEGQDRKNSGSRSPSSSGASAGTATDKPTA